MRHQGTEHFVVARKSTKVDGAKGVRVVTPGSLGQPEMGGAQRARQNRTVFCGQKFWKRRKVKSNKGDAGVDEQTITEFERDLKKNLYKVWNRMSSGSYSPPPVRTVKIPKAGGGERPLGIPAVSDRVAQMIVKNRMEPIVDPLFQPDSYGYRLKKSALDAVKRAANVLGIRLGL